MNKDLTSIMVVLDRSGSMQKLAEDVKGGFDQFVTDQLKEPGEVRLSLVQFDNEYDVVHLDKPLKDIPPLVFQPRASTALLDALGRGINELRFRISTLPEEDRPAKVIVLIITDGLENTSREFDKATVQALVKKQREEHSWEFVYIGANVDEVTEAGALGVVLSQGYEPTGEGVRSALEGTSKSVSSYRSGDGYKH